jgi:hypothetical protein
VDLARASCEALTDAIPPTVRALVYDRAWVDNQEIDIMTGRCWTALRRPLRAVAPLEQALRGFPDEHARDKALYLLALAEAYLHGHELELAAQTIAHAHRLTTASRPRARRCFYDTH